MEKNKVTMKRITVHLILAVLAVSLYINYHFYKENQIFKRSLGTSYQDTVTMTLFYLKEKDVEFWIDTLQKDEKGDVVLERYIGNLNQLSRDYMEMDSHTSVIDMHIKQIASDYRELETRLAAGEDIENHKQDLQKSISFLRNVLTQLNLDLGEKELAWYKELSNTDTETSKNIWEKYKQWEKETKQ